MGELVYTMVEHIDKREAFVDSLVSYVETNSGWVKFNKREAVVFAIKSLTTDIGAAQDFLDACDIRVDKCLFCEEKVRNPNQLQFKFD